MKILYAFQGTGNVHLTRAKEIIPILQRKGEVDVLVSGNQTNLHLEVPIKFKLKGLNFVSGNKGGINFWESYKKVKVADFLKEIKSLPIEDYDVVVNDFEPVSAWAAKRKGVNVISLSHQNAVLDKASPKYKVNIFEKLILKYYAPAKIKFGFHFQSYSSATFTPVIRQEIRYKNTSDKEHYTVYLPSYADEKIAKILSEIPIVKWHIFSKETKKLIFKKNITIYPVNEFDFIKSMASSSGVLCGAGFETPAEALYLQKKLMVIPMKNQYEQKCNALALKEMGVPVLNKLKKKKIDKILKWIQSDKVVQVNYPDNIEDILEAILLPYYHQTILPITTS